MYNGAARDEEGAVARVGRQSAVFEVQRTQAGLDRFVSDLLATCPEAWGEWDGPYLLLLPTRYAPFDSVWSSVQLNLLQPSQVKRCAIQPGGAVTTRAVNVSLPSIFETGAAAATEVRNPAFDYAEREKFLKRERERLLKKKGEEEAAVASLSAAGRL